MLKFLWSWALYTWGGLHRYFGHVNVMPSEHERAIHYFERAYQVDPSFTAARLQKGVLLSREFGRHDEALHIFDAILDQEPENTAVLLNKGLALQANGRYREALTTLESYLAQAPSDSYRDETIRLVRSLHDLVQEMDQNDP